MPYDVVAAGAVVTRRGGDVLLVHRPRYDDWSFPKGKQDPGEHVVTTAVREVAEETGLQVRLGPPLDGQRYAVAGGRMKTVHYWVARVVGDDDVCGYTPNREIDQVAWVPREKAEALLTYDHDRATLARSAPLRRSTRALVLLRHAEARSRKAWRPDDRLRPLLQAGGHQAEQLVPVLAAWDLTVVLTSSSTRCVQTVTPYSATTGRQLEPRDELSEEDATASGVHELVDQVLHSRAGTVLCTHRPVLPSVCDALGIDDVRLQPAGMLVVHHRKGRVVATETHALG